MLHSSHSSQHGRAENTQKQQQQAGSFEVAESRFVDKPPSSRLTVLSCWLSAVLLHRRCHTAEGGGGGGRERFKEARGGKSLSGKAAAASIGKPESCRFGARSCVSLTPTSKGPPPYTIWLFVTDQLIKKQSKATDYSVRQPSFGETQTAEEFQCSTHTLPRGLSRESRR